MSLIVYYIRSSLLFVKHEISTMFVHPRGVSRIVYNKNYAHVWRLFEDFLTVTYWLICVYKTMVVIVIVCLSTLASGDFKHFSAADWMSHCTALDACSLIFNYHQCFDLFIRVENVLSLPIIVFTSKAHLEIRLYEILLGLQYLYIFYCKLK